MQDISRTATPCFHPRHILQDPHGLGFQSRWRETIQKYHYAVHGEFHENSQVQHPRPIPKQGRERGGEAGVDIAGGRPARRGVAFCCLSPVHTTMCSEFHVYLLSRSACIMCYALMPSSWSVNYFTQTPISRHLHYS